MKITGTVLSENILSALRWVFVGLSDEDYMDSIKNLCLVGQKEGQHHPLMKI